MALNTDKSKQPAAKPASRARKNRLSDALRANLRRRKGVPKSEGSGGPKA